MEPLRSAIPPALPLSQLATCLLEDPRSDGDDQAALFCHRYEPVGGNQPLAWVTPPDQGFNSDGGRGPELHHRLVMEHQLVVIEGLMERLLSGQPVEGFDAHRLPERLDSGRTAPLGPVHCRFCVRQQLRCVIDAERVEGDPRGGIEEDLVPGHLERLAEHGPGLLDEGHGPAVGTAGAVHEKGQELISSEPGHEFGMTRHPRQALGHRHQHQIAGVVTHRAVDDLEAIEIEEGNCHRTRRPVRPGQRFCQ